MDRLVCISSYLLEYHPGRCRWDTNLPGHKRACNSQYSMPQPAGKLYHNLNALRFSFLVFYDIVLSALFLSPGSIMLVQTDRPLSSSSPPGCTSPRLFLSIVTEKERIRVKMKRDKRDREAGRVMAPPLLNGPGRNILSLLSLSGLSVRATEQAWDCVWLRHH